MTDTEVLLSNVEEVQSVKFSIGQIDILGFLDLESLIDCVPEAVAGIVLEVSSV